MYPDIKVSFGGWLISIALLGRGYQNLDDFLGGNSPVKFWGGASFLPAVHVKSSNPQS